MYKVQYSMGHSDPGTHIIVEIDLDVDMISEIIDVISTDRARTE